MGEVSYLSRGYLTEEELCHVPGIPRGERLPEKKCAILECPQEIPCDPCQNCCPTGAISLRGQEMTSLPVIDPEKCVGCGTCIAACPGMAIFVVDPQAGDGLCQVEIPYEFLPIPEPGTAVEVCDRSGAYLCDGVVSGVRRPQQFDHTAILAFTCSREFGMLARAVRLKEGTGHV